MNHVCERHPGREAAVRCPSCGVFFCRECVVEHGDRYLCARCVRVSVGGASSSRSSLLLRRAGVGMGAMAGAWIAWLVFYAVGTLLLWIPDRYHDGTAWRRLFE